MLKQTFFFVEFIGLACLAGVLAVAATPEERRESRLERFPTLPQATWMVDHLLLPQGGLENEAVMDVMRRIPRSRFVPPLESSRHQKGSSEMSGQHTLNPVGLKGDASEKTNAYDHRQVAYRDQAIPIGDAQTISPPYIVAFMTEQLHPQPGDKVLEIGTGSGYQAAVLSLLVDEVYSIEIVESLGKRAKTLLQNLGMDNVHVRVGDGYQGWPEAAPFDSIIVTCSPEAVPQPLVDQLREGGRMMIPLGERFQQSFYLCKKVNGKLERESLTQALFVPMTGQAENERKIQPDGSHPALLGGRFAEVRDDGTPVGWHYARNVAIIESDGQKAAQFTSVRDQQTSSPKASEPQQFAQLLQGFAVDGRALSKIRVHYTMKGEKIVAWHGPVMTPTAVLCFFDETRQLIDEIPLGRCMGTFGWKPVSREIAVTPAAREAILLIGLPLASGRLAIRDISVQKVD